MSRATCRNCERRFDRELLDLVSRHVGGSYNRAHRWQKCLICPECVDGLLARATPGPGRISANRWSLPGLRWSQHHRRELAHLTGWAPGNLQAHLIHHHDVAPAAVPYDGDLDDIHRREHRKETTP